MCGGLNESTVAVMSNVCREIGLNDHAKLKSKIKTKSLAAEHDPDLTEKMFLYIC